MFNDTTLQVMAGEKERSDGMAANILEIHYVSVEAGLRVVGLNQDVSILLSAYVFNGLFIFPLEIDAVQQVEVTRSDSHPWLKDDRSCVGVWQIVA